MSDGGRCVKHDNWHAHCQQCCREEAADLRTQRDELAEAVAVLNLAVRVSLAFQRPTAGDGAAHLLDVERVSTSADLVSYLRVALDRERAALAKVGS